MTCSANGGAKRSRDLRGGAQWAAGHRHVDKPLLTVDKARGPEKGVSPEALAEVWRRQSWVREIERGPQERQPHVLRLVADQHSACFWLPGFVSVAGSGFQAAVPQAMVRES